MQKLKRPEYHAELGPTQNQGTLDYFINPLTEDAETAAQRLPRKLKKPKIKKPKAKKPKKKGRPAKSGSTSDTG